MVADDNAGRSTASAAAASPAVSQGLPDGERRHATVVLCDLSGYTALGELLDPEEVALLLNRIMETMTRIVEAHGGTVNQIRGDEVAALFGVPVSHDDDPRRAVAAAIEMHRAVRAMNDEIRLPQPLAFHTGIDTGLVVTQRRDEREGTFGVTGDAVNTAARLRTHANADEILLTTTTYRAIEPFFETEHRGSHVLRGKSQPLELYRVLGPTARTAFDAARRRGLSRYTGRDAEHQSLNAWLVDARGGRGRFVAVVGDPGLGKSRLMFELRRSAEEAGTPVLEEHCESYGAVTPYHPFLGLLRDIFELRPDEPPETHVEKVVAAAAALDVSTHVPVYLHVLSLPGESHPLPAMLQDQLRAAIPASVSALIASRARRVPTVLLLEDWHWADEGSERTLRSIARVVADHPLLVVVSLRPEADPDWNELQPSVLRLRPLDAHETDLVVASRFSGWTIPEGLAPLIHARTGGNPFFIEELCRSLSESSLRATEHGTVELLRPLDELVMPEAVHAVVRARIDRLEGPSRELVRVAAVLGPAFSTRLLRAMIADAAPLPEMLRRLEDAELIHRLPDNAGEEQYGFTHIITRDVAYELLLLQHRRELHARAGAAIERLYSGRTLAAHYEVLAEHYVRSADVEKAIHYTERAARKAARTFALTQARRQYERLLYLLDTLPRTPDRLRRQVNVSITWAAVSVSAPAREQVEALERFHAQAQEIGYRQGAASCSYWMGWIEHGLGNHYAARRYSERALALSDPVTEEGFVAHIYLNLGQESYHEADYATAEDWLTRALATHERTPGGVTAHIVVPNCLGYLALVEAERGRFDAARAKIAEALAAVRAAGQRQLEASMLTIVAWIHAFTGEWADAVAAGEEMRTIGEAIGGPYILGMSKAVIGTARAIGLREAGGIDALREAVAYLERHGILLSMSLLYGILAEALATSGDPVAALCYVDKAFARCEVGDRVGEIQAYRARGRALAATASLDDLEPVHACFDAGVGRARTQRRPREEALTWLGWGEALLDAGNPTEARPRLARAATAFDAMAMRWHAARARALTPQ